ncbi:mas-related G-protein coupled receptor member X2 [Dasypus novemcinctus]|uniref:mas-related G-protein coupled receptor member X2 n=1 Tax=Dasypus novemcinctus TaxID=9361 RepID=UPI00265DCD65|nr:mas-related G-protein coupled receptor member X2 [Dasypus novemcinctus]
MDATSTAWSTEVTWRIESEEVFPGVENLALSLLTLIISPVGLVGNGIVLWLLGFCMRRNVFSVYILNLASVDFLFLCCRIMESLEIPFIYYHRFKFEIPKCFEIVLSCAYITGLSLLSALSVERCLSVLCPVWYRCSRPKHTSSVVCALLWALSLLLSILDGNYCGFLFSDFEDTWCRIFDFITAAWLIFLFAVLSGSSLALLTRMLCGSWRMQLTRPYVAILLSVLAFLLCGLPYGISWFLLFWTLKHPTLSCSVHCPVGLVLACVNSCANPIIYFFVGSFRHRQRLRQTLRLVLQRALQDVPETDDSGASLPPETMKMA